MHSGFNFVKVASFWNLYCNATMTFHFQSWFWIRGDAFPANSVALDKLEAAIMVGPIHVVAHLTYSK